MESLLGGRFIMHSTSWAVKLVFHGLIAALLVNYPVMGVSGTQKPNILVIMADDQDLLMDSLNFMPNVHSLLIQKGTTFSKHYCTSALCCPSRINTLTGKCVHNTNVTDVNPPYGAYPQFVKEGWNDNYLPLWLQDGEINTYYVGKLTNGHNITNFRDPVARGWTGSHFLLDPGMYDYTNTTWTLNNQDWTNHLGVNSIDINTQHAVSMLETAIQDKDPWFMVVAPAVPHVGINASGNGQTFFPIPQPKWANAFSDKVVPRTPNWNSPIQESGASWILNLPMQNKTLVDGLDHLYRQRIRCIAGLDDMVADLVSVLDKHDSLENTHIIFTSDNGYHIGQHRLGPGKKSGYETDVNVPLIWRGPGVPSGEVSTGVSTHTDLAPTFLSLFDLPQKPGLDGQIIPVLSGQSFNKNSEHVNIELWAAAAPYEVDPYTDIKIPGEKNNTYKGLRIVSDDYSFYYSVWCTNEHELYNMVEDEYQMHNLLPKTLDIKNITGGPLLGRNLGQVVQRLDALMMVLKSCSGNECVNPWLQLHPQGDVQTLQEAMSSKFDEFYHSQPKVSFSACILGYLPEYEGPQKALQYQG